MTKKKRTRHNSEQIVKKLRDADAMLHAGKELAVVLQTLELIIDGGRNTVAWRETGKRKKRRLGESKKASHRRRAELPNHVWSWDFVFDRTTRALMNANKIMIPTDFRYRTTLNSMRQRQTLVARCAELR